MIKQVLVKLEKNCWDLKQISIPPPLEIFRILEKEQYEMKTVATWCDQKLSEILDTVILDAGEIEQLLVFQQDLFIIMKQLEIYIEELQMTQRETRVPWYSLNYVTFSFRLVIVSQPFPDSVKQHKSIDEPLTVRLLAGAKCEQLPHAIIRAEVISLNNAKTKKNAVALENAERTITPNGLSQFSDLKFPTGTRLKSIRLSFTTKFHVPDNNNTLHTISLESNISNSIVVKTNENQWFEAEGILLKKTAFGTQVIHHLKVFDYIITFPIRNASRFLICRMRFLGLDLPTGCNEDICMPQDKI